MDAFHVYAMEWAADTIRGYVDNLQYFKNVNEHSDWQAWPFDKRFHFILNIAHRRRLGRRHRQRHLSHADGYRLCQGVRVEPERGGAAHQVQRITSWIFLSADTYLTRDNHAVPGEPCHPPVRAERPRCGLLDLHRCFLHPHSPLTLPGNLYSPGVGRTRRFSKKNYLGQVTLCQWQIQLPPSLFQTLFSVFHHRHFLSQSSEQSTHAAFVFHCRADSRFFFFHTSQRCRRNGQGLDHHHHRRLGRARARADRLGRVRA